MADFNIDKATPSQMTTRVEDYEVGAQVVDGPTGAKETEYMNDKWPIYWGYFNDHTDLKSAILMKAIWNVGKSYTTDNRTKAILERIRGWGKDSFDDILFNMEIQKRVNGDAFAEIINDKESGELINLKPLDPGSIKIVVNEAGIIKRYEQVNKLGGVKGILGRAIDFFKSKENKKVIIPFKPHEIFHLSNNRIADQIHGISDIRGMEEVLKAEEESFNDMKRIMHRSARPMILFKLKTDDQNKIDKFVQKMDEAMNKGENLYVPDDENIVSWEVVQINVSQIVMEWRNDLRNKFYRTIGLPQIIPGASGQSTESESKVIMLAFEHIVSKDQRFLEKQIWNQLAIRLTLNAPESLSPELKADTAKDTGQLNPQLNPADKEE